MQMDLLIQCTLGRRGAGCWWTMHIGDVFVVLTVCAGLVHAGEMVLEVEDSGAHLLHEAQAYRLGTDSHSMDMAQAVGLYEQAAKEGAAQAWFELGFIHQQGDGGWPRNHTKALEFFQRGAQLGQPDCQASLGFIHTTGVGVPVDEAQALVYYHFAAITGTIQAEAALGYRFQHGYGVPRSCETAARFYKSAAEKVAEEGQILDQFPIVEKIRLADEGVVTHDLPDENVLQVYEASAEGGNPEAKRILGHLYHYGAHNVPQDLQRAHDYLREAAEGGDAVAMGHLGQMYVYGHGVEQNNETALRWFRQGAAKGGIAAIHGLGYMYENGIGVERDHGRAFQYFSEAAKRNDPDGQFDLANMYIAGHGVKKNYGKALEYFSLAANQGHVLALYNVALMHLNGYGIQRSCDRAVRLLKSVTERGAWAYELSDAYHMYLNGDYEGSLLRYSELAEQGYEVAQSNAAFLYERGLGYNGEDRITRALRLLRHAAGQGSPNADLRIGDFYFYGHGTAPSMEKAVRHYRAASGHRNAQAMFNLGYMHEHGLGLAQDYHLAKRYYDMAVEVDENASLAVYTALGAMYVRRAWAGVSSCLKSMGIPWDTALLTLCVGALVLVLCMWYQRRQRMAPVHPIHPIHA